MGSGKNKIQNAANQGAETAYNRATDTYNQSDPGLSEIGKTGGITPAMRTQTANTVSSIFSRLKSNLARRKRIQGGYNPGYAAQEDQLGRTGSEMSSEAVNNLNATATQNRLAALGKLGDLSLGYGYLQPQDLKDAAYVESMRRGVLGNIGAGVNVLGGIGRLAFGPGF